jgi:glycosyltransferase involved in cell wall biosynthesis
MKYITFTVPCYNSQDYMRHCIDNLVAAGDDIEVIIVNDGSKDDTGKIAAEYENKYPNIVKAIQKENGGHGSGVMAGIHHAKGIFYKVVDSDDWIETKDVLDMVNLIKRHMQEGINIDLYINNYVYENANDNSQYVMHYRRSIKAEEVIEWKDMTKFKLDTVLLMHSLMYRLDKLKQSKMELPNHTFYVDDIYAYVPFPYMGKIFYHDIDLYHYFIGRSDQSINYKTMCKRYEQQMRVYKIIFKAYTLDELRKFPKPLYKYMIHWLMIMCCTTIMTIVGTKEDKATRKKAFKQFFKELKAHDKKLYNKIRYRTLAFFAFSLPSYNLKSFASVKIYRVYQKKLKLG